MFMFSVVKSSTPSYQKLQCRLTAPSSSTCTLWLVSASQRKKIKTDDHLSMCNCSGATELDKAVKFDLHGAHFRGGDKYAGTYPAKMSTMVLIFAYGAQIRARICAPVHVYARGIEYAVTPPSESNVGKYQNGTNVGKYQNGTSYTRVSTRHQWTRLVLFSTPWLSATGEDRRVEEGLFHCGRLQSRGVKQENSAHKPCFNVFYMFRWNGAGWAARTPRARMNSKKTM